MSRHAPEGGSLYRPTRLRTQNLFSPTGLKRSSARLGYRVTNPTHTPHCHPITSLLALKNWPPPADHHPDIRRLGQLDAGLQFGHDLGVIQKAATSCCRFRSTNTTKPSTSGRGGTFQKDVGAVSAISGP